MAWERGTLADVMGNRVYYRNLQPADPSIPGLKELWPKAGLARYYVPRKTAPEYARVLVASIEQAMRAHGRGYLRRALFIGDTLMNDGTAARNIAALVPTRGFIAADRSQEPANVEAQGILLVANRWEAVVDFQSWLKRQCFACDDGTVVLIDVDKTAIGARGRNDRAIDQARIRAMVRTLESTLNHAFDPVTFREVYDTLNQPAYHPFTADNQDYLAYICLMVTGGVCSSAELWQALQTGTLTNFESFVSLCEQRRGRMNGLLAAAHDEVRRGLADGDPTPFKAFRRCEYYETVGVMDYLPDETPPGEILANEIVLTAEVMALARNLASQGALIMGVSDKPDEASIPPHDALPSYRPIHRTVMKVYGRSIT